MFQGKIFARLAVFLWVYMCIVKSTSQSEKAEAILKEQMEQELSKFINHSRWIQCIKTEVKQKRSTTTKLPCNVINNKPIETLIQDIITNSQCVENPGIEFDKFDHKRVVAHK